jgi:hypothetical protein
MAQFYNHYESSHSNEQVADITASSIEQAQQHIYGFFLGMIKYYQTDEILDQFNKLFINYEEIKNIKAYYALGEIIFHNREEDFKHTLLRCCYILNNNWALNGNLNACQSLVDLFLANSIGLPTKIHKLKKLRTWLQNFVKSDEYNTLRSLSGKPGVHKNYHTWCERFSSYLLIAEYTDFNKPVEQRQYAEIMARKIKKQFKFDLAMYTARIGSKTNVKLNHHNPTNLGDGVLILIKKVLNKQGHEGLRLISKKLRDRINDITFLEFKEYLFAYLDVSRDDLEIPETIRSTVIERFRYFQPYKDDQEMTTSLLHVSCNRILQYLLLNERRHPSDFLRLSLDSNNFLSPVILLLKVVLLCPKSRLYLESYIAELIKFYSSYDEVECRSFINFLDILNVTLAIFDEDTDYSLVKMKDYENDIPDVNLDNYRVFSQYKKLADLEPQPVYFQENKPKTSSQALSSQDITKTLIS